MCELLWSDPQPMPGRGMSKRGVGTCFGPDVTNEFLSTNGLGNFSTLNPELLLFYIYIYILDYHLY